MNDIEPAKGSRNILGRLWTSIATPSTRYPAGLFIAVSFIAGALLLGGFNWTMHLTYSEAFCISCHSMESTVYPEYKKGVHYSNPSGVKAECPDCHNPPTWWGQVKRKIPASLDVLHTVLGSIDTRAKFEAKRMVLAKRVWARMYAQDSPGCRGCHDFPDMKISQQRRAAQKKHPGAVEEGRTCIECHKGIAHKLPPGVYPDTEIEKALAMPDVPVADETEEEEVELDG